MTIQQTPTPRRSRRPGRLILLAAVVVVTACGASEPTATSTDPAAEPGPTTESTGVTPTTAATSTTQAPPTTTQAPTTTVPEPATTTTLPPFPPARDQLVHGDPTWAVVLAGSADPGDTVLAEAELAAGEAGYTTGLTDCDEGAAEALGMPAQGTYTVSVYLETEEDAEAAATAFAARGVEGVVAEVRTFCLD